MLNSTSLLVLEFPLFVKWYITGNCNLKCSHCYLTSFLKQPELSLVIEIIDYLSSVGVHHISFIGGEPLLRDDLEEIVSACSRNGIKTKIATNGVLLCDSRITSLSNSGARSFQVSLEGHSAKTNDAIRGEGTFKAAIRAILALKRHGLWVGMALTLNHENVSLLSEIYALAYKTKVDELKLAAFLPVGTGAKSMTRFMLTREDLTMIRKQLPLLMDKYESVSLNSSFLQLQSEVQVGDATLGCGAGTSTIVINSDLTVSACDILAEEDRSTESIRNPLDIKRMWEDERIFFKWRRKAFGRTLTISDFAEVHNHGCHVAYSSYKMNIFR